jgi:sterol desaturase/sphingolipid hydroxylase (fatty acid hydroxylase superfamily)
MEIIIFFQNLWLGFVAAAEKNQAVDYLLPTYVGMVLIERFFYLISSVRHWHERDALTNVLISSFNLTMGIFMSILIPFAAYYWLYENARIFAIPNTALGFLICFLLHDLFYYIDHRIAHRTGLFWAFHHVHHSSKEFNFTVAARGFWGDGLFTQPIFYLMPILGMSLFQIALILTLKNIFGIFNHTRLIKNMGFWEYILCTPSNHRVHHGSDIKYLDKNYGQVLIIWDRLFGSFKREEEEPRYGLVKDIDTYNPLKVEFAGVKELWQNLKSTPKLSDKLKYLYMPPGWRPDGKHETTEAMLAKTQHAEQLEKVG